MTPTYVTLAKPRCMAPSKRVKKVGYWVADLVRTTVPVTIRSSGHQMFLCSFPSTLTTYSSLCKGIPSTQSQFSQHAELKTLGSQGAVHCFLHQVWKWLSLGWRRMNSKATLSSHNSIVDTTEW